MASHGFLAGQSLTITQFVGLTCMAVTWAIGGVMLALGKFSSLPWGLLPGCPANIAFYLYGGGVFHLVSAGVYLCLPLGAMAFKMLQRRWDRQNREYQELRELHYARYPDCTECFGPAPA